MARQKRGLTSAVRTALKRLAGLTAIDPTLDLGHGLTVADYQTAIQDFESGIADYNAMLSNVDAKSNDLDRLSELVGELNHRIMAAVGSAYGFDSDEYEKVGGTRKSEIKRSTKKDKKDALDNE